MPQICTVCSHPKSREIDIAIIRGEGSNRRIASQNKLTERAIRDHRHNHLSERLQRARERDAEKREISLRDELYNCFEHARKLRAACDDWLTDPDDETKYTLDARAREVMVIYDEYEHGAERSKRKRAQLETLLNRLGQKRGLGIRVERTEIKVADTRKLILASLDRFDKHLRMLGDLTGEFKEPQANPLDNSERIESAIKYVMERAKCDRGVAVEALGPQIPEIREYEASQKAALGTWSKPHQD